MRLPRKSTSAIGEPKIAKTRASAGNAREWIGTPAKSRRRSLGNFGARSTRARARARAVDGVMRNRIEFTKHRTYNVILTDNGPDN